MQPFRLIDLVLYFLKLGSIGFGGPVALLGYMQRDLVEKRRWFSKEDYLHGVAFSQMVPGPVAAQLATYFGYKKGKVPGATLVAIAFILPSFLIVLGLAHFYVAYQRLPWIHSVFYGMGAALIAIISLAAYRLAKITLARKKGLWIIASLIFAGTIILENVHFVWYLFAGLLGIAFYAPPKRLFSFVSVELFLLFFKASIYVYGGGMAILPFVYGGVVHQHHWLTEQQFLDSASVGMITPGPFLITTAFIGFLVNHLEGALLSAVGSFLPVYLFVVLLLPWYYKIAHNAQVKAFVSGVTAAVAGGIAGSSWLMGQKAISDYWTAGIALTVFLLLGRTKIPDALWILAAGFLGFLIKS